MNARRRRNKARREAYENPPRSTLDVKISGAMGFYSIEAQTRAAARWMNLHVEGVHTQRIGEIAHCDDGGLCREIVAGMVADGLHVEVNGVDMKGFKRKDGT